MYYIITSFGTANINMSYTLPILNPRGYKLILYRSKELPEYLSFYIDDISDGRTPNMIDDVKMSTSMWSGWMKIPDIAEDSDDDVIERFMCVSNPKIERHYGYDRSNNGAIILQEVSCSITYSAPHYCKPRQMNFILSNQRKFEEFDKTKHVRHMGSD